MIDRRVMFFAIAALAAALLYPAAPADLRWVAVVVASTYTVLAALAALDAWGRHR